MLNWLKEDIRSVFARDPAARSVLEVLVCYPGLHALWFYRASSFLWRHDMKFLGRATSHAGRFFTGIEIHPGAKIGKRFFIDHGMGVVIGETAEVGDDVLLYQGVVLGGTSLEKKKRHPTIGNNVVIGSAAILLGPIVVGDDAMVGANSVVVKNVPPGATVVGIPARVVGKEAPRPHVDLQHGKMPDPMAEVVRHLHSEQERLKERMRKLEEANAHLTLSDEEIKAIFSKGAGI